MPQQLLGLGGNEFTVCPKLLLPLGTMERAYNFLSGPLNLQCAFIRFFKT